MKWIAVGCWIVSVLYVIALACMWKSLQISLAVLEAASDFIGNNLRVMLIPIAFFVYNVVVFICWIAAIITVFSVGDIDNGPEGT